VERDNIVVKTAYDEILQGLNRISALDANNFALTLHLHLSNDSLVISSETRIVDGGTRFSTKSIIYFLRLQDKRPLARSFLSLSTLLAFYCGSAVRLSHLTTGRGPASSGGHSI
jgi:hypothetical protein